MELGLFNKIFGNKNPTKQGTKAYQLVSTSSNYFAPWSGNVWENDIVRSCIRPKSNAIGKLSPKHLEGFGENMKINNRPYIKQILEQPNPFMSMQDFLTKMVIQRELNHNAFAYIQRDEGCITGLYPIPFSRIELLEYQSEMYVKFWFKVGQYMTVPYEDVIHLRKDFNNNDIFGDSNYNSLKNLMEVVDNTDQSINNAIKNSSVIRWLLKFKNTIRPEDKELEVKTFVENYLSVTNKTGAAATDPKFEAEQIEPHDYVPNASQMRETTKRLYAYFGVNEKIVMNTYDEDEFNAFYEAELEPIAIQLSNAFTRAFFSLRERGFGNKIVFESSSLQYANMTTKLNLVQMVDRGSLTPNEWRLVMNLGPIEGGDKPIRRLDTAQVKKEKEGEDDGDKSNGED